MAYNGPMGDTNYGWGGNSSFEDFEKAANAAGWNKTLKQKRTRSFVGDGAFKMTKDPKGAHPGANLVDTIDDNGNIVWQDKTADNYILSPNEQRNLNAYLLKYSPDLHESSQYSTPFDDGGYVSTEDFDSTGFNLSDQDKQKYVKQYKDFVKTKYSNGGYIKYFR